jgi:hypothetical protein
MMSRLYRTVGSIEVDATLDEKDYAFWQDVLFRAIDDPSDVLDGRTDPISLSDQVEVYPVEDENKTQFRYDLEMSLCGGQDEDEFAEEVRQAIYLLTQTVPASINFRLSLDMYYLEHDPDLSVEYDRAELAV